MDPALFEAKPSYPGAIRLPAMHSPIPARSRFTLSDRIALAVLAALGAVALFTFKDYGLGWDDYAHSQYGEMLYAYYASGFTDIRAFSFVNLYYYGGGFDIAATVLGKLLPFGLFETRRLLGAAVGIVGIALTWRTARRVGGPQAGLAALVLLASCPLYYGHMFINAKDTPFAVAMIFLLLALIRAFEEYPKPRIPTIALFGLALGLTIGTRVIGGVAAAFVGIGFLFLFVAEWRVLGLRDTVRRAAGFALRLTAALPLAYVVMGLVWPWSVQEPLNPLRAIEYFSHFWEKPWKEVFDGVPILIPDMPRSYLPKLCVLKLPEIFIALAIGGGAGAIVASARKGIAPQRRAILMLLVSAALLPILLAVITKPVLYNGVRHFLFITPPLAVLGGLAAGYLFDRFEARRRAFAAVAAAAFTALILLTTVDLVRIHPYQYALFNHAAGGMARASQRYMTDYWGLGLKETAESMLETIKQEHLHKPRDRKWKVAVCGPAHTAAVELGPDFETTYETRGADFAISLGTFYCAQLDAPVLGEAEREGVVFARAYDLRGRHYVTTYSTPPDDDKPKNLSTAEHQVTTFWH